MSNPEYLSMQLQGVQGDRPIGSGVSGPTRLDSRSALVVQLAGGKYREASRNGRLFMAHAIVTAPVIYTTAAGTGGPIIHNRLSDRLVSLVAVGFGVTTVATVAAALGITGNKDTAALGSTTAIDSKTNCKIGGANPGAEVYRVATPGAAGSFFVPFGDLHTGALTVDNKGVQWVDLDGMFTLEKDAWASVAASATASTTVASITLVWEEIPLA